MMEPGAAAASTNGPPADPAGGRVRSPSTQSSWGWRADWLLALVLLGGLVKAAIDFNRTGYLPLPFWPDANDVYADGYSTAWWAFNGGAYDTWRTVYPPVSFVLTKMFGAARCYDADVGFVRDCDWSLWWWMLGFYALNAWLAWRTYHAVDRRSAVPRTIGLMLGLPMLYAFEHLNLLVFAYTGLFIFFGAGVASARLRWVAMAIAINLKVYLVMVLLGQLLKRRWRTVEWTLVAVAAVYGVTFLLVGEGTPYQIVRNIRIFATDPDRASSWYFVFYASSYKSMVEFFVSEFRLMPIVGSWPLEFWGSVFTALILGIQAATLATFAAVWATPQVVSRVRVAAMCYLLVLISNETGGYATAGAVFLVFFERWKGAGRVTALTAAWFLCLALDWRLVSIGARFQNGYFGGRPVWNDMWLTVGPFVRPGLIMLMQIGLVTASWGELMRHWNRKPRVVDHPAIPAWKPA